MPRKLFDAGVAAVHVALGVMFAVSSAGGGALPALAVFVALAVTGAFSWTRREHPLRFMAVSTLAALMVGLTTWPTLFWVITFPLALFSVAAYEPREALRQRIVVATLAAIGVLLYVVTSTILVDIFVMAMLVSVVGWGRGERARRDYTESLEQRALAAERERDIRAVQAVAEERARIARDIHDLVSHSLAVVAVQAAGAERIAERNPVRAKEALGVIATTSREALAEMRAMLQVLRSGGESATDMPSPALADVDRLVEDLRTGGMEVELTRTGEPFGLGAGAELALFRVVQESLTNAMKHGSGRSAEVKMHFGPDSFVVEVTNPVGASDGSHPHAQLPGGGSGQAGMRERLALYGGTLSAVVEDGSYRIRADVPRGEATAT